MGKPTLTPIDFPPRGAWLRAALFLPLLALAASCPSCGPDYNAIANRLRATTLEQKGEIAGLRTQLANRDATIADLRDKASGPPLDTLPPGRLAQLFTAASIEIRSGSDTWDAGDGKGTHAFRIYLRLHDADGQIIPATGAVTIEAIELPPAPAEPRRLGTWTFTPEQMKRNWYSGLGLNQFALTCPWESPPTTRDIVLKVHYKDALTGNVLEAQISKKIHLPPPAQTSQPSPQTRP
jgi:hypothetical protein